MAPKIQRVAEIPNLVLGEGPHWDIETQSLYFVDIFGKSIHKFNPSTGQHSKAIFGKLEVVGRHEGQNSHLSVEYKFSIYRSD